MDNIVILVFIALVAISEGFHRRERGELLNRLMSRDYAQFRYYEDKWKGDVKAIEQAREDDRKAATAEEAEGEVIGKPKVHLKDFEDFAAEEDG